MNNKLIPSQKRVRRDTSLSAINADILIALFPCAFWAVFLYGTKALWMILSSVAVAIAADALIGALLKKNVFSFLDLSPVVCGAIVALLMPASISYTSVVILSLISTVLLRLVPLFEKLPLCPPALVLAVATLFMKEELTVFPAPSVNGNAVNGNVYPITSLIAEATPDNQWYELFFGSVCGPMGTASVLLILAGAIYLLVRRIASLKAVLGFMAGVAVCAYFITGSANPFEVVLYTCLTGQFLFGAVFCVSLPMWTVTDTRFNILIPALGGAISVLVAFKFSLLAVPIAALAVGVLSCLVLLLKPSQPPFGGK